MKLSQAFPSKYLKAEDLQGRSYQMTVSQCVVEEVGADDKPEQKLVIYFREAQKGWVCSRTKAEAIAMVLGDETDHWLGHVLELFTMKVAFKGKMVDSIQARPVLPQQPAAPTPQVHQQLIAHPLSQPTFQPVPHPIHQLPVGGPVLGGNAAPAAGIERTLGAQGLDNDDIPF